MSDHDVPVRANVPESDKWDLRHLFADVSKWQEDFRWVQQTYPRIAEWKGRLGESAKSLADLLEFERTLDLKSERLYHFASLQLAEDSANNEYLARVGQVQNLLTKIGEAAAFLFLKFKRSTTRSSPSSLPIRRWSSGRLNCTRFAD